MVDEIKLPKIVSSVSAAGRINKVKRRESNTEAEHFHRQLHEEQKKEEQADDEQTTDLQQKTIKGKELIGADPGLDQDDDGNMIKNQGSLIDVVI